MQENKPATLTAGRLPCDHFRFIFIHWLGVGAVAWQSLSLRATAVHSSSFSMFTALACYNRNKGLWLHSYLMRTFHNHFLNYHLVASFQISRAEKSHLKTCTVP